MLFLAREHVAMDAWLEDAEDFLDPWLEQAVIMSQTIEYIDAQCDSVSKGYLMHAQNASLRFFFGILEEFKNRHATDVGDARRHGAFDCRAPSRCLVDVCRQTHPELYTGDEWVPQ